MLMATFERTHELGMLLALGTAPRRIVGLIVVEAIALGLVGALLGVALGGSLVALTHRTGIDYATLTGGGPTEISFAGLRWSLRLYPSLALVDVVRLVAAVVVTSLAACAWPAARAARLEPARALRD
jgi:ABC-type lipoprotein release transport system permease subunit